MLRATAFWVGYKPSSGLAFSDRFPVQMIRWTESKLMNRARGLTSRHLIHSFWYYLLFKLPDSGNTSLVDEAEASFNLVYDFLITSTAKRFSSRDMNFDPCSRSLQTSSLQVSVRHFNPCDLSSNNGGRDKAPTAAQIVKHLCSQLLGVGLQYLPHSVHRIKL